MACSFYGQRYIVIDNGEPVEKKKKIGYGEKVTEANKQHWNEAVENNRNSTVTFVMADETTCRTMLSNKNCFFVLSAVRDRQYLAIVRGTWVNAYVYQPTRSLAKPWQIQVTRRPTFGGARMWPLSNFYLARRRCKKIKNREKEKLTAPARIIGAGGTLAVYWDITQLSVLLLNKKYVYKARINHSFSPCDKKVVIYAQF